MIAFDQVQSTLKAKIAAKDTLADVTVVEHLGTQADENTVNDALTATGVAISVLVPVRGRSIDQGAGSVLLNVEIPVLVEVNVDRNTEANNPDAIGLSIYQLFKATVEAALNPRPTMEKDRFGLAENALSLDVFDAGLFRYQIMFTKKCVL
jgi:hypothetical protein